MAKPKRWSPAYRPPHRPGPSSRQVTARSSRIDSLGVWAWMAGSVAFAFFVVLVVLDLPLCTRSSCDGWPAVLGSAMVGVMALGLAVGGPVAWWRIRGVGGRP